MKARVDRTVSSVMVGRMVVGSVTGDADDAKSLERVNFGRLLVI